ncbi:MAG: hypothetical protein P9L89_05610 [Candidatus Celaenobacter polaris]|nr:hypothetical protein [Candidatus Celaenobacter polaris]
MKNNVLKIFVILFLACALLNADKSKNSAHTHYCMVLYGKNQLLLDSIKSHKNISVIYNPLPNINGFGLNTWYIQEDHTSYYGFKESLFVIQPSTNILYKSLTLKLGINVIILSEGEEPGMKAWLPAFEIKLGNLNKLYFSAGYRSELFFGRLTANLNYRFNDNTSSIMLGYAYFDDGNDGYSGFTYKIDYTIFQRILLRVWGNANFSRKLYGTQV